MRRDTIEAYPATMISLIITTCDRPAQLQSAIESALNQKYVTEIILINDGRVPVENLPARIKLITTTGYGGICAARNLGLNAASQPYVAYLDDDDELHPDAYSGAMNAFEAGAQHLVVSNVDRIERGGGVDVRIPPSTRKGMIWEMDFDAAQGGFSFHTKQSTVYKAEFLRSMGGWEERLRSRSQCDLFFRISQHYDITGVNSPCYILNRNTSHEHLTDSIGLRFKSFQFLIRRHFSLWIVRLDGWKWFLRESLYLLRMVFR